MTNPDKRALEIIDLITTEEDMTPTESLNFTMNIAKFCIETSLANIACHVRQKPEDAIYLDSTKQDIMNWIENGIKKGNELYEAELN